MDFSFSFTELSETWQDAWQQTWHLIVAFVLAVPIGWDRERRDISAGVRTFPLVAVAACGVFLVGESFANDEPEALSRLVYGVMTGMGFLGGGAILKEKGQVTGLTTAASLWNTAVIGLAVGADQFPVAIALSLVNFVLLKAKRRGNSDPPAGVPLGTPA